MSESHTEVVLYVGIAVHDPAFKGLHRRDQDHIRGMADATDVPLRPILRHGDVVGYGIPIIIADHTDKFREVDSGTLYAEIERSKAAFRLFVHRVSPPPEPKLYAPQLLHIPLER